MCDKPSPLHEERCSRSLRARHSRHEDECCSFSLEAKNQLRAFCAAFSWVLCVWRFSSAIAWQTIPFSEFRNEAFSFAQVCAGDLPAAEGEPEFINEVMASLLLLIVRGQAEFLVGPKVGYQFFDPSECFVEARWHLRASVRRNWSSVNSCNGQAAKSILNAAGIKTVLTSTGFRAVNPALRFRR